MVRLTLLKFEDGTWDQAKPTLRDDLDTIELGFNRAIAEVTALATAAAGTGPSVTVEEILPVAMLMAGAGGGTVKKSTVTVEETFTPALLLMGGSKAQSFVTVDPFPSSLLLGGM